MTQEQGLGASSQSEDRATRASPEPASGLGQKASVPCADPSNVGLITEPSRARRDAADAMYDALEAFVAAWNDIDSLFQPQMPRLVKQAEAALAKARGQ